MSWLNFFKKPQQFFADETMQAIVSSIREVEKQTSGEVRVFIEKRCRFVDPVDRAKEVFFRLKMEQTRQRNGVLIYIALLDKQLALFGDEGIHNICGAAYWSTEVRNMIEAFRKDEMAAGIINCVRHVGETLHAHFPYTSEDKNELPDEIVFGD